MARLVGFIGRVWQWLRRWWPWPRQKFSRQMMLLARIDTIETRVVLEKDKNKKAAISRYAKTAREALDVKEFERAWRSVIEADCLILQSQTDEVLDARASALVVEAPAVLPAKEAQPVLELLAGLSAKQQVAGWRDKVIEAQYLFERRIVYLSDTRERVSARIAFLGFALLTLIVLLLWYVLRKESLEIAAIDKTKIEATTTVLALLFGGIGGCLSALLSFTVQGRVPGMFEGVWGTIARPLVGAVSGLIGVMLVGSSFVNLDGAVTVTAVPFVFGFSERLVLGTVQKLEAAQKV